MDKILEKWDEILHTVKTEHDISEISFNTWIRPLEVFGVEGDIGTVGRGIPLVGACSIANSNGAIVAKGSTGPEMARVEEALGFLDDNF